jgi:hypothetical protein
LKWISPWPAADYMEEDLRQAWKPPDKETAQDFLVDWIYRTGNSEFPMLVKMARTVAITSMASWPITTIRSQPAPWKDPTTKSKP